MRPRDALYLCETSTSRGASKGNTGWGCVERYYPPGSTPWDPAASANLRPQQPPPPPAPAPAPTVLTPETLATADLGQWKNLRATPLDGPPIKGDWAAFDAVGNIEWASSIAKIWKPDAMLYRLSTAPEWTGASNVRREGGPLYEFNSPTGGDLDLTIMVHQPKSGSNDATTSYVDVSVGAHRDSTPRNPLAIPKCTISRALAAVVASHGKEDPRTRPTMDLMLVGRTEYWAVSYVPANKSTSVEVMVNAATCVIEHPK